MGKKKISKIYRCIDSVCRDSDKFKQSINIIAIIITYILLVMLWREKYIDINSRQFETIIVIIIIIILTIAIVPIIITSFSFETLDQSIK